MNDAFADWLGRQMKSRGLSQRGLAKIVKVAPSAITRWANGTGAPSVGSYAKLAEALDVSVEEVYAAARRTVTTKPSAGSGLDLRRTAREIRALQGDRIPVLEQHVSAGRGQQILDYIYMEPSDDPVDERIALQVEGTSMEPDIKDGDIVVINPALEAEVGDIVVAVMDDQFYVKWLRQRRGRMILVGNTGEFEAAKAQIQGVVIEVRHPTRRRRGRYDSQRRAAELRVADQANS